MEFSLTNATKARTARSARHTRTIVASFAAGVGLMMLAGVAVTASEKGGLAPVQAAVAAEAKAPVIAPLDVAAVQAELAQAEALMEAGDAATDAAVAQLKRHSR